MPDQPKRLYRSQTNKVVAGVCGGIAEYLDIDPTLVRIIMVLLTVFGGWGLALYIVAIFIVPQNPSTVSEGFAVRESDPKVIQIIGGTMVVIGIFVLLLNLDFFSFRAFARFIGSYLFPLLLIGAGIYILTRRKEETPEPPPPSPPFPPTSEEPSTGRKKRGTKQSAKESEQSAPRSETPPRPRRQLMRSILNRKMFGVCGGLAEYFDIDPSLIRILFVIFTFMSFGFGVLLYIVLIVSMPDQPRTVAV